MAHAHAHNHAETESTYFLDQLCTVAVGGLLGFTAIGLYEKGWLWSKFQLIDRFHVPIFAAGIALVVMVAIRAVAIWRLAGQARAQKQMATVAGQEEPCDHDHSGHEHSRGREHSHAHSHSPAEKAPSNDEGHDEHDHGWAPWRYAVLIIPAVLFFLGLPSDGFNQTRLREALREQQLDAGTIAKRNAFGVVAGSSALSALKKQGKPTFLKFSDLNAFAINARSRDSLDGRIVILEGQFQMMEGKDREFKLFRVKVNCCGPDAITLQALIISPEALQGYTYGEWVKIEGELTFQKITGQNKYLPVIQLPTLDSIEKIHEPANSNDGA